MSSSGLKKSFTKEERAEKKLKDGRALKLQARMSKFFAAVRSNPECLCDLEDMMRERDLLDNKPGSSDKANGAAGNLSIKDKGATTLAITSGAAQAAEAAASNANGHNGQDEEDGDQDGGYQKLDRNKTRLTKLAPKYLVQILGIVEPSVFSASGLRALVKRGARTLGKDALIELLEHVTNQDPSTNIGASLGCDTEALGKYLKGIYESLGCRGNGMVLPPDYNGKDAMY